MPADVPVVFFEQEFRSVFALFVLPEKVIEHTWNIKIYKTDPSEVFFLVFFVFFVGKKRSQSERRQKILNWINRFI